MDWSAVFGLSVAPLELVIRGTAMYLFLFVVFRVVVKRRVGAVGMADIRVLVNILIDWLTFRFPPLQKVLEPPPLLLIDGGRVLWRRLRQEFLSEQELRSKLREHGVTDYGQVQKAFMESDGQISVIKKPSFP